MFEQLKMNLKHNRKSVVRAATAWMIFGAIILVFVFWGLTPQQQGVAEGGAAAEVNGATISLAQYADVMERMRRDPRFEQLQSLGGDAGRQIMQQQAISQLVEMELIRQATDKQKIWTTDAEVREVIFAIPQFQEEGRFKASLYRGYLEAARKTPAEFEDEIRREQSLRRTVKFFSAALKPLKLETEKLKALSNLKANVEFVSVPTENLVIPETVKAEDIKAFLAQPGSEAKIKDYFDSRKGEFSTPERVKVRHILIRAQAGDGEAEKKALAKIEGLAERAKKEDFAKLASEQSEDPGTKAKGGLLDFFPRGKMVPAFEEVAFSSPLNEISKPVKTEYGYHLIQTLDKKPATNRLLEEVKEEIAGVLVARERTSQAIAALQENLKAGDEGAVRKFVAEHKLKWEESGPFSIETDNVPKIGANEDVVKLAFGLEAAKPLATTLVREGARALILRYKPVVSSGAGKDEKRTTKDDRSELMNEMASSRRAEESLRKWIDDLRKTARVTTNPSLASRR